jgi:hypothetical protein
LPRSYAARATPPAPALRADKTSGNIMDPRRGKPSGPGRCAGSRAVRVCGSPVGRDNTLVVIPPGNPSCPVRRRRSRGRGSRTGLRPLYCLRVASLPYPGIGAAFVMGVELRLSSVLRSSGVWGSRKFSPFSGCSHTLLLVVLVIRTQPGGDASHYIPVKSESR